MAAGSVVTRDVAADSLVVARGRQDVKLGWAVGFRDLARAKKAGK